jgi:hypothetical protein
MFVSKVQNGSWVETHARKSVGKWQNGVFVVFESKSPNGCIPAMRIRPEMLPLTPCFGLGW